MPITNKIRNKITNKIQNKIKRSSDPFLDFFNLQSLELRIHAPDLGGRLDERTSEPLWLLRKSKVGWGPIMGSKEV